jgi:hypothetical protein
MNGKPFEVVAISPEPGAITLFSGETKMLPPNHFRKPAYCLMGIRKVILMHETPVVY